MAIYYKAQLNMGNEALGSEPTITANESLRTADRKALARELAHQSHDLIPENVADLVLQNFCKAAVELMSQGFAIQLDTEQGVGVRIFPDVHVKGGNINLARAKQLDPTVTELTADDAGRLIDLAGGVTCRVRCTAMQPFTDLLNDEKPTMQRDGTVTKAYVAKADGSGDDDDDQQGGDDTPQGGGGDNGDNE